MNENKRTISSRLQIGAAILCFLMGISAFMFSIDYLLAAGILCFGVGNLLGGFGDNKSDLPREKSLTYYSFFFLLCGAIAIVYYALFALKK